VEWLRADPVHGDGVLALVLVTLGLIGLVVTKPDPDFREPDWIAAVLVLVQGGAMVWRRRHPLAALGIAFAASIGIWVADYQELASSLALVIGMYSVAAWAPRRAARIAGVLAGVALLIVLLSGMFFGDVEQLTLDVFVGNFVIFGTAYVLGENVRNRRERLVELEERAIAAETAREQEARRAVAAERTRIARELHDVVAHSVSVMVVQAGAARRVLGRDPEAATESLCSIEEIGRQSLTEMRRLLGVLRREDDQSFGRAPQPSVAGVDALVASTREAGLDVELVVEGEPRPLPPGVDLSAYRIVQEALTNTLKHAGPAKARVRIRYGDGDLQLEVTDDGRGVLRTDGTGGHGLVGMRERVSLYGGELTTGNRPGGGYVVRARLPLASAAVAP
jgi:signal transduction histidine kinase